MNTVQWLGIITNAALLTWTFHIYDSALFERVNLPPLVWFLFTVMVLIALFVCFAHFARFSIVTPTCTRFYTCVRRSSFSDERVEFEDMLSSPTENVLAQM